jgi:HindIII restriction endonuclease
MEKFARRPLAIQAQFMISCTFMQNPAVDWNSLIPLLGANIANEEARQKSYILLESYVEAAPRTKGVPITGASVEAFRIHIKDLNDKDLAILLIHSGFIPDQYINDSSEETLYSKLVEALVAEWGQRVGHVTSLPTAKASVEDVTFVHEDAVIVSDIKSYRLGRSQKAPNVKDVIKAEDYNKWLGKRTEAVKCGGLVIFGSRFDFSGQSDVYLYASNATLQRRILILFFEHLAFLLLNKANLSKRNIFDILDQYPAFFPKADKSRAAYWKTINAALTIVAGADPDGFFAQVQPLVKDCILYAAKRIETRVAETRRAIEEELKNMGTDELRERLLPSEFLHKCGDDVRRLDNIKRFRL